MKVVYFLAARLSRFILTLLVLSTVVFFLLRVIPGDPALAIAGIDAAPQDVQAIRERIGTDRPLAVQYAAWLGGIARFEFGSSFASGRPVTGLILERVPLTLTLAVAGIAVSVLIAVPFGILSAVRRWSLWDYAGMLFSQLGLAVPGFWLGIVLLLLFAVKIPVFPLFGAGTPARRVLPALALGASRAAVLLRLTRASMIEELGKEYILTARAKGLPDAAVKYRHALRNALLPVVTVGGIQFGYMLGGAIIIEQVFSLPGLGRLFLNAVYQRDFPLVQGGVVFTAVLFMLVNFTVDVLYSLLNPRIRLA